MTQRDTYSQHVRDDRANSVAQAQREVINKLLGKLKESERTVMTLHYLGEMKIEEISRFLGVSVSTIKTRLMRARQRLQKEETMIREALEYFQISPNLTDNIMQEVSRLKPTPSGSKPLIPWTIAATTAVLIVLMLGIGNQHLARFQEPYSLEAQTEIAVELLEVPIVQDILVDLEVRNQIGSTNAVGKSNTPRLNPDEVLLAAADVEGEDVSAPKKQWNQSTPMSGSSTQELVSTSEGDLYSYTAGHLYKLPADGKTWQHLFEIWTLDHTYLNNPVLAEWNKTLYFTQSSKLFASIDDSKTWNLVYSWKDTH